jgi:glucoamylase
MEREKVPRESEMFAPGWPGIAARWTSSAKTGLGTAMARDSRVWFTLSHGILNEIYYPRVDCACTRDLGLIVTDGDSLFSDEKRDTRSETTMVEPGVPAYRIVNTAMDNRYEIEKEICTDPWRDVVLQRVRFTPHAKTLADYGLYVLLAPHLQNRGSGQTAWVGDYKGSPMLFAQRGSYAMALACSVPWIARSVGFVGASDGWQELRAHKRLTHTYHRAENGNVALTGQVDLPRDRGGFVLALGFGPTAMEAGQHARMSLLEDFEATLTAYVDGWKDWHQSLHPRTQWTTQRRFFDLSTAVLRCHEDKRVEGGVIASLSIPWGFSKGDDDIGGYHLVWPRDLVEAAGGFLAIGAHREARRVLRYLEVTQEADGHWAQNMWLDATPYWSGIQMDETALPILLVNLAGREGALDSDGRDAYWPMVRQAAAFLVRNGPVSPQDRWEEDPGYSPFTVAAEITALLVAADLADAASHTTAATYLRETADAWNASIERWLYVEHTDLAREHGVDGYYVRVSEPDRADAASVRRGFVPIKHRPPEQSRALATSIVSVDALALVRFGLRAPDDPRILDTLTLIDALLKVETPSGPAWHRYTGDGYGEHADGGPFDGTGIGRAWPLLTGERAHFELAAGHQRIAEELADALEAFAGSSGLIPEQIWDSCDVPAHELYFGHSSGSASPLVWAHAEYLKLCRSLQDGYVFDQPAQARERYLIGRKTSGLMIWRYNNKIRTMRAGMTLRIETFSRAQVHWTIDGWQTVQDTATVDTTLGVHIVDLPTTSLSAGGRVDFTFYWLEEKRWEGIDFSVLVA